MTSATVKSAKTSAPVTVKPAKDATPSPAEYNRAVKSAKAALAASDKSSWVIGDLAGKISTTYGDKVIQRFATDLDRPYKTVCDFRTVAGRYTDDQRVNATSWTVHQIFAGQDDRAELVKANWTTAKARELVNSRKPAELLPENDSDGSDTENSDSETDRAKLVANVEQARANLATAEIKLAEYDAAHLPERAPATVHSVKGIPQHDADDTQANCPMCELASAPAAA